MCIHTYVRKYTILVPTLLDTFPNARAVICSWDRKVGMNAFRCSAVRPTSVEEGVYIGTA